MLDDMAGHKNWCFSMGKDCRTALVKLPVPEKDIIDVLFENVAYLIGHYHCLVIGSCDYH